MYLLGTFVFVGICYFVLLRFFGLSADISLATSGEGSLQTATEVKTSIFVVDTVRGRTHAYLAIVQDEKVT